MNIPAKMIIEKMEEEVNKLKASLNEDPPSSTYVEQATAIKTYCDLILSSDSYHSSKPPSVRKATVEDVKGELHLSQKNDGDKRKRLSPYDEDDAPNCDSLLDF